MGGEEGGKEREKEGEKERERVSPTDLATDCWDHKPVPLQLVLEERKNYRQQYIIDIMCKTRHEIQGK